MNYNHPACKECVLSGNDCLLQQNDDVESCEDVREYDLNELNELNKPGDT